jgi:energy-coupling factor transporter transmembrane protein EcfT
VLLMFTTPYPQVFAPIQRVVPTVIGDALLMTYRSLFLLLEKFSHTLTAVKLRAGLVGANPVRSAATITRSLGGVLLYSIDLSQRTHDVMHLRGYDGRLVVTPQPSVSAGLDRSVALAGVLAAVVAVAWRLWWPVLNPYAWIPPLAAVVLLAGALIVRAFRKDSV